MIGAMPKAGIHLGQAVSRISCEEFGRCSSECVRAAWQLRTAPLVDQSCTPARPHGDASSIRSNPATRYVFSFRHAYRQLVSGYLYTKQAVSGTGDEWPLHPIDGDEWAISSQHRLMQSFAALTREPTRYRDTPIVPIARGESFAGYLKRVPLRAGLYAFMLLQTHESYAELYDEHARYWHECVTWRETTCRPMCLVDWLEPGARSSLSSSATEQRARERGRK